MKTNDEAHRNDTANITVDTKDRTIHRGHQTVAEIKMIGEVPLAYELEQIIENRLIPLDDNGSITIKGGETFVSHPKDGGSS